VLVRLHGVRPFPFELERASAAWSRVGAVVAVVKDG